MYVLANMWFQNIMRTFFFSVDKIVFGFISTIYDLLITIARTSVLSQADILDMADRVYKLLAVFMVFKVTFSLIMYVVNPDDFSDKSKGVSKLGMNIVFSLAMLILTPYIFSYAYQLQTIILEDNSLAALVFGDDVTNAEDNPMNSAGDTMAFITLSPFFTPNISLTSAECGRLINTDGKVNEKCTGIEFDGINFGDTSTGPTLNTLTLKNDSFSDATLKNYIVGVDHGNLGMMFRLDMAVATNKGNTEFVMEYRYIFSTVVGVIVVLLLLTFCMDVALRSIKLAFLQLIAPIPILSYVDPKSGKDGMFKKWYQMCFKTYLSLFLRLLALYFAVYIISRVDRMVDIVDGSYQTNMLVKIFIIIGALMFAKSFTKILEGLGLKLDGGFTLNPLKKMENEMLGGKTASKAIKNTARGAAGLAMGGAIGTLGTLTGAGALRGLGGAWNGMVAGMKGKKIGEIRKMSAEGNTKMRQAIADGSRFGGRLSSGIKSYFGLPTSAYNDKNEIAEYDSKIAKVEQRVEPLKRKQNILKEIADTKGAALKRAQQKIISENAKPMFADLQNEIRAKQAKVDSIKNTAVNVDAEADLSKSKFIKKETINGVETEVFNEVEFAQFKQQLFDQRKQEHQVELAKAEEELAQTTFKNQKIYVDRNLAAADARNKGDEFFTYEYRNADGSVSAKTVKVDGTDGQGFEIDSAVTDIQENIKHLVSQDEIVEINNARKEDGYTEDIEQFSEVMSFSEISNLSDMATDESRLLEVGSDHVTKASKSGKHRTNPTESIRELNTEKEKYQQSKRDIQTSDRYKQHQADDSAIK